MALAQGFYTLKGNTNANGDVAVATPATPVQTIHVLFMGIDTTTAGTTSTAQFQDSAGGAVLGNFNTTALGHDEILFMSGLRNYPGAALAPGNALNLHTAGGAAATISYVVVIEVK